MEANHSLLISADKTMFIAIYMNDIFFFDNNIELQIDNVIQNLQNRFLMTDLSDISYYLRIEVDIDFNKKTISL